jgi:hypothetical protein
MIRSPRHESVQDSRPAALDASLFRRISQAELVDEDNERPLADRCELDDHAVVSLRVLLDE